MRFPTLKQLTPADVIEQIDSANPSFAEMKAALRAHYGADSLTDGRATDMVADYVYLSQFERVR